MTGVLIVEDQQVLASALEIAIGTQPDMDCVGTATTVEEALTQIAERLARCGADGHSTARDRRHRRHPPHQGG